VSVHARRDALAELLRRAGREHHAAFSANDGDDPDWPAWYAAWLESRLSSVVPVSLDAAALETWLRSAEARHRHTSDAPSWPEFYAADFIDQFV